MEIIDDNDRDAGKVLSDTQTLIQSASLLMRLRKRHDLARVASAITIAEVQLTVLRARSTTTGQQSSENGPYDLLLNDARASLRKGDIDSAWKSVQALEREMLQLLTSEELTARWISARNEAQDSKVGGWRTEAASKLEELAIDERDTAIAALREILFHIHASSQNTHNKNNRLRTQITWSAMGVTILVLATVILNDFGFFAALGSRVEQTLPLAVFSGLLGGVLSVAFNVARSDSTRKIPEVRINLAVTMVRPVIGAAIALPVMLFLESGLIIDDVHQWVVLSLCFVGGFSEQWFLGMVEKVESST